MRILVAEDDPRLRSVLQRALRENGYAVDAVADGQEALGHLRAYDYAVMVLDWRMPKMSGIELLRQARARHVATPVLMLTAKDTTADRVTGLDTGADDYPSRSSSPSCWRGFAHCCVGQVNPSHLA